MIDDWIKFNPDGSYMRVHDTFEMLLDCVIIDKEYYGRGWIRFANGYSDAPLLVVHSGKLGALDYYAWVRNILDQYNHDYSE